MIGYQQALFLTILYMGFIPFDEVIINSISITRYVDITSGVGAGAVVPTRDLVGRLFTGNILIPPQSFISFFDAAAVGSYFGTGSEEYARAVFYFSFISKSVTQPGYIQFARWVNSAAAPRIFAPRLPVARIRIGPQLPTALLF